MGRVEQPEGAPDEDEGRLEMARELEEAKEEDERPAEEEDAEADLLNSSGGDPFTQESD